MKKILLLSVILLMSGCSGNINQTDTNLKIKFSPVDVKSWNVLYDSVSGYNKAYGTLIINEIDFTPFKDVNTVSERPNPEYLFSDLRGKKLTGNIYRSLSVQGVKLSGDAEGVIIISRPAFLDEGRYILRTYITFFGKDKKEIAILEIFNNLRKETTSKGIRYKDSGDLMDDSRYADFCAEKILSAIKQITGK
ncbi:MAG: hypothetical protein MUE56_07585 [Ignavibacteria bacterium]|jgi:hypothetical protein|nr:hypothetical protein [Ignavibacteria bacterium]